MPSAPRRPKKAKCIITFDEPPGQHPPQSGSSTNVLIPAVTLHEFRTGGEHPSRRQRFTTSKDDFIASTRSARRPPSGPNDFDDNNPSIRSGSQAISYDEFRALNGHDFDNLFNDSNSNKMPGLLPVSDSEGSTAGFADSDDDDDNLISGFGGQLHLQDDPVEAAVDPADVMQVVNINDIPNDGSKVQ